MTTRIEMRRHSIKDGDDKRRTIGRLGYAFAADVGRRQLRGRNFDLFFVSPLERTAQTMQAFGIGAGDFPLLHMAALVAPIYATTPELKSLWRHCHQAEARGEDMVSAAWEFEGGKVAAAAQAEYLRLFREFVALLNDGTNVLLIGHSPHLEFLAHAISGVRMPGLKECEGFGVLVDGDALSLDPVTPSPTVAELRREFDLLVGSAQRS